MNYHHYNNFHVIDFEVFPCGFWLCVILTITNGIPMEPIVIKDSASLSEFYLSHRGEIYVSYNGVAYDQWIFKAILAGIDPYKVSNFLINEKKLDENGNLVRNNGWEYSPLLNNYYINMFDVYQNFRGISLKRLEGRMGDSIKESSVSFNIEKELTEKEKQEIAEYCKHDVRETARILCNDSSYYFAKLGIINDFGLRLSEISKTSSRLAATVLRARKNSVNISDQWDIVILPCVNLTKYPHVEEKFLGIISEFKTQAYSDDSDLLDNDAINESLCIAENAEGIDFTCDEISANDANQDKEKKIPTKFNETVASVDCTFGLGGTHAALKKYHHKCSDDEIILDIDVESYYPSIMLEWNLGSRASSDFNKIFKPIKSKRLELKGKAKKAKRDGNNKLAKEYSRMQQPLKILINAVFGSSGDKYSALYDPKRCREVCINGQLMLLMLIEKLESHCTLIQANTDGLFVLLKKSYIELVKSICKEWEDKTRMKLDYKEFDEIHQRDVSNYIAINHSTHDVVRKGKDCKEKSILDNELAIVNDAVANYFIEGKNPRETIYECDELIKFQRIYSISDKYGAAFLGNSDKPLPHKNYRVFASTRKEDPDFRRAKKDENGNYLTKEKFTETPEHCFIDNGDIKHKKCPDYLDKDYYVNLAIKRINSFIPKNSASL